jgi:hypothetical protein
VEYAPRLAADLSNKLQARDGLSLVQQVVVVKVADSDGSSVVL